MNAAVCVVVTVPTEAEERRRNPKPCACCGGPCAAKPTGSSEQAAELCDRCWRLGLSVGPECEAVAPVGRQRRPQSRVLALPKLKDDAPMEQLLRAIAEELRLEDAFWSLDLTGKQLQVHFNLQQDERFERLLCTLQAWGVGERPGTHVSALTCLETRDRPRHSRVKADPNGSHNRSNHLEGQDDAANEDQVHQGWQTFMDSVRCRLNVNQVVRQVRRDATFTFDFVVLLVAAALLSCVGLVENSFLFLSSSMLISPLMGPIIAAIFGSVIGDRELRWLGLKNELLGIGVSVGIGFLFGGIVCGFGHFFTIASGLTDEIVSRCDTHSLAIGVCTALASGAAGAIAVLGGNTGSLVGVAISASLLPPAVNAGLLWALAIGSQLLPPDHELLGSLSKHRTYSTALPLELFVCAAVSMALTLLNVVCVWLMGVVVLRIKEVAPAVQRYQQFWRHDVRTAREVALFDPALQDAIARLDDSQMDVDAPHYQNTWSPGMERPRLPHSQSSGTKDLSQPDNYNTVHGFQEFCITLHRLKGKPKEPSTPTVMELFSIERTESSGTPTETNPTPTGGSGFGSCRSLPDISSSSRLWAAAFSSDSPARSNSPSQTPQPHTHISDRTKRNVHWREDPASSLPTLPSGCSDRKLSHLSSRDSSPRRKTGKVLIPLPSLENRPPDRSLAIRPRATELQLQMEPPDDGGSDEFQV
ncbi:hypothetical protein KR018_006083 [Drosophila ironensis]|nr:hypothetical protein KR018_006083 [Drosophila ironensis]